MGDSELGSYYGYAGRIICVDLSARKISKEKLDLMVARKFIGGLGLSTRILYDEVGPNVDPMGPNNVIVISTGVLVGTGAPTSNRVEITTKSPLTGIIGTGNFGGYWGHALKHAGYDAVVIKGRSKRQVYLWIEDDFVEVRNADHLLGKDCWETEDTLRKELGKDISVMSIGQAGENMVRFACPIVDYDHAPGRSHAGCVMGTKRLKAIAVRGTKNIAVASPNKFKRVVKEIEERIVNYPQIEQGERQRVGSLYLVRESAKSGQLGSKNFQSGVLSSYSEAGNPEAAVKYLRRGAKYGHRCLMGGYYGCDLVAQVDAGKYAGLEVAGIGFSQPQYDFGVKCGIESHSAIWKCVELCQRYGMDWAGPIPFAMELFQRGIITKDETDGVELTWGNEDAVLEMLKKIAYRDGFGDILGDGSVRASKKIGRGAEKYVMTIKGMELLTGVDPRVNPVASTLGAITGPRGGDNLKGTHGAQEGIPSWVHRSDMSQVEYARWFLERLDMPEDVKAQIFGSLSYLNPSRYEGKAMFTKWYQDLTALTDSLGLCLIAVNTWSVAGPSYFSKLYSTCTGVEITPLELMKIGERIFNLMKMYNVREGLTRKDDNLPARFYEEPLQKGPAEGTMLSRNRVNQLLDEYYDLRAWDRKTGIPTKDKLRELGLSDEINELEELGYIR